MDSSRARVEPTPLNRVLSKGERRMLALVGQGMTNQNIAFELGVSVPTVKATLHRACVKLGARNRSEALITAILHRDIGIQEVIPLENLVDLLGNLGPETLASVIRSLNRYRRREDLGICRTHLTPRVVAPRKEILSICQGRSANEG